MKILIVTEDLPVPLLGGAGKHAVLLANTLIEAGHHVEMLGRQREPGADSANGFLGKLHTGINLRGTGWKEQTLGVFLPMRRLHLARRVWQAIQERGLDWDVIHYHGHFPAVGALVPKHINFVHTLHDQGTECITRIRFKNGALCTETDPVACAQCATPQPNAFQKTISAWAVQHHRAMATKAFSNHKAIFVSRFLADRFSTNAASNIKIRSNSVHNFIDAEQLRHCLHTANIPQKNFPKIFMAGRIDTGKGFGPFLDALPDAAFTNCEVTVAGDGPELRSIRERHEKRGVQFLGWQPIETVLAHTVQADIYVQPSLCEEACSTTVLEALALQRPVFALSRGSIPELAQYQTYTNQLQLFDNIESLAIAVSKATFAAPSNWVTDAADVRTRLPEILSIYASNFPNIGAINQCKT